MSSQRGATAIVGLGVAALLLGGCSGLAGSSGTSQVRMVDASPDVPAVDVYQGSGALAYNLGFGTQTSYVSLAPGVYTLSAHTAGSSQQLTSAKATVLPGTQYTLLLGSTAGTVQQTLLRDQATPAPVGQVAVRFLNQAVHAGSLDLYLIPSGSRATAVSPLLSNISFGANSGYLDIRAGTYTLMAYPAGTAPGPASVPVFTGPSVTYAALAARTVIVLDQPISTGTQSIQILTANDFDPAGTP